MPMYRSPHQLVRLAHQLTLKAVTGSMGRMAEMLAAQKQQRELEALRDRKRRELFARQDEIQGRRDGLIDALELQLQQQVTARQILAVEWEVS